MHIKAENISKNYNHHVALKDFSAEFLPGKITGLLGPNGAGKTTFIRILNQIIEADSGTVTIDSNKLKKAQLKKIGYLPEERGLYKKMKVAKHIRYLARLKGLDKTTAKEKTEFWLEKLQLKEWRNKRIEQLSKGMAQKVQFISTIIHEPELLILDEPFSGFDPINTFMIRKEILELKKAGKTIILSTHNMNSVEEICDHVILLNNGKTLLNDELKTIRKNFSTNSYKITFKGNIIAFTNALWAGYELVSQEKLDNEHHCVHLRMLNNNTVNNLLNTVLPHVKIQEIVEIKPGMEDVFIKAIEQKDE